MLFIFFSFVNDFSKTNKVYAKNGHVIGKSLSEMTLQFKDWQRPIKQSYTKIISYTKNKLLKRSSNK